MFEKKKCKVKYLYQVWERQFPKFKIWEGRIWDGEEGHWVFGCKIYLMPPVVEKPILFWNSGRYPEDFFHCHSKRSPEEIISMARSIMRRSLYERIRREYAKT